MMTTDDEDDDDDMGDELGDKNHTMEMERIKRIIL